MNNRALTLSLVMAVLAVFFVQSYVSSIEDEAKKKFGTESLVVTAKRDIKEMDTINETALEFKLIPKRFLEPAAVSFDRKEQDEATIKEMKGLAGLIAMVPIKEGEQITYNKIIEPSLRTGVSPQVTPGRRAVTIGISDVSGVAKLIKPGDRVDVIAVVGLSERKESKVAKTILQDVVVLAVGKYVTNNVPRRVEVDPINGSTRVKSLAEFDGYSTVTLEVEPGQVQLMALIGASGENSIILSLRNNDDTDRVSLGSLSIMDVFGADFARIQRAPAERK